MGSDPTMHHYAAGTGGGSCAKWAPLGFDDAHDGEQHVLARGAEGLVVRRLEPAEDLDVDGGRAEVREPRHDDLLPHERMRAQQPVDAGDDLAHLRLPGRVAERDGRAEADAIAQRVRLDARIRQAAVRDRDDRAVEGADARRARADVFHGADDVVHLHRVADAAGLIGGERDRPEQVLDGLLRAEGERDAADAEAGHDRGDGVAERGGGRDRASDHHRRLEQVAAHEQHGAGRRIAGRPRALDDHLDERVHRAPHHPEDGDHAERRQQVHGEPGVGRRQLEEGQRDGGHHRGTDRRQCRADPLEPALVPDRRRAPRHPQQQAAHERPQHAPGRPRAHDEQRQRQPLPPHQPARAHRVPHIRKSHRRHTSSRR